MKNLVALSAILASSLSFAGTPSCRERVVAEALTLDQFHYRVMGAPEAPPLVLLHGLGGSSESFALVAPILAKKYRVILYDQRGHGRTAQKGWDYSLEVMAGDLASLLDGLKISSAHVLGLSFGARTAMVFSQLFPERVRSLLVIDMEMVARVVNYEEEYMRKARLSENLPRYFASEVECYRALREFEDELGALELMDSLTRTPDGRYELLCRPHGMYLYDLGGNGRDLTEPLRAFQRPLLFVRADPKNSFLFDNGVAHIKRTRPDVRIFTVPGAAHQVHQSHPQEFLRLAVPFFDHAEHLFINR